MRALVYVGGVMLTQYRCVCQGPAAHLLQERCVTCCMGPTSGRSSSMSSSSWPCWKLLPLFTSCTGPASAKLPMREMTPLAVVPAPLLSLVCTQHTSTAQIRLETCFATSESDTRGSSMVCCCLAAQPKCICAAVISEVLWHSNYKHLSVKCCCS